MGTARRTEEEHSKWVDAELGAALSVGLPSEREDEGGIALSYSRNQHNIVEQLSFKNIKSKQKMWYI